MDEDDGDRLKWLPDGEPVLTAARAKSRTVVVTESDRGGIELRSIIRPLDKYVAQNVITGTQYYAGNRIYSLWKYSILHSRYVRMNYGEVGGGVDLEQMSLAPKEYLSAVKAIHGDYEREMIFHVCIREMYAGRRKPMVALRSGLTDLADYFKSIK